jgi:hypothetical protein
MFTVISWCTASYKNLAENLRRDCEKFNYPYHLYEIDEEYLSLVKAWCNHPKIIKRGIEQFGSILFLDVECRIVRSIPKQWRPPLLSVRKPAQPFWLKYNSGTIMADEACLPWVDAWINVIETWGMANLGKDAYIYWENDICDEIALSAALAALDISVNTVQLEYIDRTSAAEIVRGFWKNTHTIIQHPTVHHWIKQHDPIVCKQLFIQNYGGEYSEVDRLFSENSGIFALNSWVFDTVNRMYAPNEYWDAHQRPWVDDFMESWSGRYM